MKNKQNICKELELEPNDPEEMYQLMNAITLAAARIKASNALSGAKGLINAGYTYPDKVLKSDYWDRVKVLTDNQYKRFDESRARFLEQNAKLTKEKYKGDLTSLLKLKPHQFKQEVQNFIGIGPAGAEIFYREVKPHIKKIS